MLPLWDEEHRVAAALCKSASVESLVSLLGSVAGIPSLSDHCDARHSGFTGLKHLRKRLAGNRWRKVSVMLFSVSWLENSWLKLPYTSCGSTCTRFIIRPLRIMSDVFAELLAYLWACVSFSYASTDSVTQLGTAAERGSTLHLSCCTFTQMSLWPIKVFIWSTGPSLLKVVSLYVFSRKSILKCFFPPLIL